MAAEGSSVSCFRTKLDRGQFGNRIVIWLNDSTDGLQTKETIQYLQQEIKDLILTDDVDACIDYVSSYEHNDMFLIIADSFGKTLIPLIHDIEQIQRIYIYCETWLGYPIWDSTVFNKVSGLFDDKTLLMSILLEDIKEYERRELYMDSNSRKATPASVLGQVAEIWYSEYCQTTSTKTQHILVVYNLKSDFKHGFETLTQRLSQLPNVHLEIEHDVEQAYKTLGKLPFTFWRTVVDKSMAKEFTLLRKEKMISLYFCVITVIYTLRYEEHLRWALNNPMDVWGGVVTNEEKVIRFCSGDPLTHEHNIAKNLLHIDESGVKKLMSKLFHTKLPFSIVVKDDDPLLNSRTNFDESQLKQRQNRFVNISKPQFVQNFRTNSLGELFSNLLTTDNEWQDITLGRCLGGIICHAKLNNRPMEHIRDRLIKWLYPSCGVIPGKINAIYYVRAFTEETFLYKDVNFALANNDQRSIYCLREYIHTCIVAFEQKLIPFYAGIVYRGVQMTADELTEYKVGTGIRFLGFMSTSKSFNFVSFLDTNVVFIIHTLSARHQRKLGRYTNVDLHASNVTVMPSEEEVLYAPFSAFEIINICTDEVSGVTYITLNENDVSAADHVILKQLQLFADKGVTTNVVMPHSRIALHIDDSSIGTQLNNLSLQDNTSTIINIEMPVSRWLGDDE
ncbi:unnamed protein product [Adineta ricciae]|uniref:NAD(P)(+)--arginine ADP-ribosyltransferase n=1 Tax=Adineta ricciae TaxID=249248 RepID=A0A814JET6_ADIRI|nr:unnamed protein product [Adineta ricciae]